MPSLNARDILIADPHMAFPAIGRLQQVGGGHVTEDLYRTFYSDVVASVSAWLNSSPADEPDAAPCTLRSRPASSARSGQGWGGTHLACLKRGTSAELKMGIAHWESHGRPR
jgi:hypothetical protein